MQDKITGREVPTNTTALSAEEHLLTAMHPSGIYAQEAQGQRELVASSVLPTEIQRMPDENDRLESAEEAKASFEALGFVFGEPVSGDPLFTHVDLPEGWSKHGSTHDMWSYVVDEQGEQRVAVFYKAAYYDRRAFMRLERD